MYMEQLIKYSMCHFACEDPLTNNMWSLTCTLPWEALEMAVSMKMPGLSNVTHNDSIPTCTCGGTHTWQDHDEGSSKAAQWTHHIHDLWHKQCQDERQGKPYAWLSPCSDPFCSAAWLTITIITGHIATAELYTLREHTVNSQPVVTVVVYYQLVQILQVITQHLYSLTEPNTKRVKVTACNVSILRPLEYVRRILLLSGVKWGWYYPKILMMDMTKKSLEVGATR